jgi:hypothetical protein
MIETQSFWVVSHQEAAGVFVAKDIPVSKASVQEQVQRTTLNVFDHLRGYGWDGKGCQARWARGQNIIIGPWGILRIFWQWISDGAKSHILFKYVSGGTAGIHNAYLSSTYFVRFKRADDNVLWEDPWLLIKQQRPSGNLGRIVCGGGGFSSSDGSNSNKQKGQEFYPQFPPFTVVILLLAGAVAVYYGWWNVKLGPQDWRGLTSLLLGLAVFMCGVSKLFEWSHPSPCLHAIASLASGIVSLVVYTKRRGAGHLFSEFGTICDAIIRSWRRIIAMLIVLPLLAEPFVQS